MEPDGIIEVSPTVLTVFYHVVERSLLWVRATVVLGDSAGSIQFSTPEHHSNMKNRFGFNKQVKQL